MTLYYKLKLYYYNLLDRLTFKRCKQCDEITIDGECDYCCNSV